MHLLCQFDNPINIFLINPNIILYYVLFINYLWISETLLVSIGLNLTEKKFATPFDIVFLILLVVRSFKVLPKQSA